MDNRNIKLNYLYRDGANYKQFGYVVFRNFTGIQPACATTAFLPKLISSEYFVPQNWALPKLQLYAFDPEIDHEWHEFENWELTEEAPTDSRDVTEFLNTITKGLDSPPKRSLQNAFF